MSFLAESVAGESRPESPVPPSSSCPARQLHTALPTVAVLPIPILKQNMQRKNEANYLSC